MRIATGNGRKKSLVSSNNKSIKKRRVMRYFIDAASEIVNEQGVENITIRNVAEKAGYNSASLYNYFDNLEHLIAFTCIDLIAGWMNDMLHIMKGKGDELDKYLLLCKSFSLHSFQAPAAFAHVYAHESTNVFKYLEEYFENFPEVFKDIPEEMLKRYQKKSLHDQEEVIIEPCIKAGFFRREDAEKVYTAGLLIHNGLLWKAAQPGNKKHYKQYTAIYMQYLVDYLKIWLQRDKDLSVYL